MIEVGLKARVLGPASGACDRLTCASRDMPGSGKSGSIWLEVTVTQEAFSHELCPTDVTDKFANLVR